MLKCHGKIAAATKVIADFLLLLWRLGLEMDLDNVIRAQLASYNNLHRQDKENNKIYQI